MTVKAVKALSKSSSPHWLRASNGANFINYCSPTQEHMTHGSRLTTHSSVNESTTEIDAAYGVPDAQRAVSASRQQPAPAYHDQAIHDAGVARELGPKRMRLGGRSPHFRNNSPSECPISSSRSPGRCDTFTQR